MPPLVGKSKPKGREGRQSRSRNTTPSSTVSAPISSIPPSNTVYLDIPIGNLVVPTNINYDDILERHGGGGGIPDPKHLETIANDLKTLAALARTRAESCDGGMRELVRRRKEALEEEREQEQAARDREEREKEKEKERLTQNLKRIAEDEENAQESKSGKLKKKKERSVVRDERPLTHGAHGLARQDGLDLPLKASPGKANRDATSPKKNVDTISGSSSSLSEASPAPSPSTNTRPPLLESTRASDSESTASSDAHQPPPAASIAQYQTFGPNPVTFDDPTVYEIHAVTDDMTDDEKKEIYCVSTFPKDDLHDLIAGIPPNKDFSNAVKPNNQVQAHTFASYLDGYLRPLKEEDIGFLNERGDRVTPFVMPRRGKRHYTEVWAEEDGSMSLDTPQQDRLPPNQPRGGIDQMDDDAAETDRISSGPLMSRLLSSMRFEHRIPPNEEKSQANGIPNGIAAESSLTNGDLPNGVNHEAGAPDENNTPSKATPIPSATSLPESARPHANAPNLSHAQIDERLKAELRHIGFLSPDTEPDYDAHYDDEVAERLRWLQTRLREVSVLNGARKQRVQELAEEQMAYQEYSTILEDLDTQVQQAYLKRARTAGKSKKNAKRPGGAGGGSHSAQGENAVGGVSKPGIGDVVRKLMTRRGTWEEKIGPVFARDVRRVRGKKEGIFGESVLEPLMRLERERWDEEAE